MQSNIESHLIKASFFLSPALLLWTHNFTVGVIAFVVLGSCYYLIQNRTSISIDRFDWLVISCLFAYLLANLPNVVIDTGNFRYFKGPIRFALCIPVYLMLKSVLKESDEYLPFIEKGVIIGSFGALGIALYQFFILEMPRVDGFLYSINFGYLSCALAFLAFTLASTSKYKLTLYLAFSFSVLATMLTLTRGAIFAIPLLLLFSSLLYFKNLSKKKILMGLILFIGFSVLSYVTINPIQERVNFTIEEFSSIAAGNTDKAVSSGGRIQLWRGAVEAFWQSPIIGLTYSEREAVNQSLYEKGEVTTWVTGINRGHAHSQYFEMLASNGLLGIIAIFAILVAPFLYFTKQYLITNSSIAYTGAIFVAGFGIYGLTEAPLQANLISTFYAFTVVSLLALFRSSTVYPKEGQKDV